MIRQNDTAYLSQGQAYLFTARHSSQSRNHRSKQNLQAFCDSESIEHIRVRQEK
jgi:hypothetical protein